MAMCIRTLAAGLGSALLIALAGIPPAAANLDEPVEIDRHELFDNNATDSGRADLQARLLYYRSHPLLLRYLMSTVEGRIILYRYWLFRQMYGWPNLQPRTEPAPIQEPQPGDLPAESILDELDDNEPLPMVGEPGSGTALKAFDEIGNPEPPAESILDQIDESPKPAVNQAAPPQIVETKN
jgi:hypothetical protein